MEYHFAFFFFFLHRRLSRRFDRCCDFRAYKRAKGDYKELRAAKTANGDVTWDIERNRRLKRIISGIKEDHIQWYETDVGDFRGLPTKEHTRCIVLAYSPDPTKLRKLATQVREKFGEEEDDNEMNVEEEERRGAKRDRDGSTSSSSDDSEPEKKQAKRSPENEGNERKMEREALSFKDREKALQSIKSLEGRDVSYQFYTISGLVKRAERVISCTKDRQKIENMKAAVEVFENWITDYNVNGRSKENFNYLPVDIVRAFKPLAERYGLENNGFLK